MPYDVELVERLREMLADQPGIVEKRMFGGVAFLEAGHMAVGASSKGGLLLRVDPAETESLLADPRAEPFVMRGRPMSGWLHIDIDGSATDNELSPWIEHGLSYVRTLPPK
ncbi:MAG TPA: TfoX/Sxy family protein [Propionibacteriaceae bacterium]|jgi:TfoX/Sxy family transcriptional regulator of competence genes|nr:TfoX/Sxy family protein [Propionibacteriaceae bacterium]